MAEQDPASTEQPEQKKPEGGEPSGQTPAADQFKPPASQAELDRIIAERLAREQAKYKDVPDLRKKAAKLDEIEAANKTEAEKLLARAEAAEKRTQELEAAEQERVAKAELAKQIADWKTKIAADPKYAGVPASALRGSTEEELREHAAELKALIPDPDPRRGAYVPTEGKKQGTASTDPREEFIRLVPTL